MNVLALYKKENGADYHRIVVPFSNMDGIDWKLKDYSEGLTDEDFDVDVVVFNRVFPFGLDHLVRLKIRYGFSIIVDLDDYWELPVNHYLYTFWKQNETSEKIKEMIQIADFVWVTNDLLYKEVRELFHDRVEVVKNAVIEKESVKLERESVNVGYASGASHLNDLKRIEGLFPRLAGDREWRDKGVFVLGGWESSKTGIFETKKKIIQKCNKYICIDRIAIGNYMHLYDLLDVSIAPLEYSKFNSMKSNLKFLESATKRLPFVCSYVPPYTIDEKLNGMGIGFSAKVADWYRNIMRLVRSVNMREEWGERNYEYCKENYNLEKENVKRIQILKSL